MSEKTFYLGIAMWSAINENRAGAYMLVNNPEDQEIGFKQMYHETYAEIEALPESCIFSLSPATPKEAIDFAKKYHTDFSQNCADAAKAKIDDLFGSVSSKPQQMTKLDQFAIAALQGSDWRSWGSVHPSPDRNGSLASRIYDLAQSMLEESEKRNK